MADFGEAFYGKSLHGKYSTLIYQSRRQPGKCYEFCFHRTKTNKKGISTTYYSCSGCLRIKARKIPSIAVKNNRILVDPDAPTNTTHFCTPMDIAKSIAIQLDREVRMEIRAGNKQPREAYNEAKQSIDQRFARFDDETREAIKQQFPEFKRNQRQYNRHALLARLEQQGQDAESDECQPRTRLRNARLRSQHQQQQCEEAESVCQPNLTFTNDEQQNATMEIDVVRDDQDQQSSPAKDWLDAEYPPNSLPERHVPVGVERVNNKGQAIRKRVFGDFGEPFFGKSSLGRNDILIYESRLHPGKRYEFFFYHTNKEGVNYYRCIGCKRLKPPKIPNIAVKNNRIIVDPDAPYTAHTCAPIDIAKSIAVQMDRDVKAEIRAGRKRPRDAFNDVEQSIPQRLSQFDAHTRQAIAENFYDRKKVSRGYTRVLRDAEILREQKRQNNVNVGYQQYSLDNNVQEEDYEPVETIVVNDIPQSDYGQWQNTQQYSYPSYDSLRTGAHNVIIRKKVTQHNFLESIDPHAGESYLTRSLSPEEWQMLGLTCTRIVNAFNGVEKYKVELPALDMLDRLAEIDYRVVAMTRGPVKTTTLSGKDGFWWTLVKKVDM